MEHGHRVFPSPFSLQTPCAKRVLSLYQRAARTAGVEETMSAFSSLAKWSIRPFLSQFLPSSSRRLFQLHPSPLSLAAPQGRAGGGLRSRARGCRQRRTRSPCRLAERGHPKRLHRPKPRLPQHRAQTLLHSLSSWTRQLPLKPVMNLFCRCYGERAAHSSAVMPRPGVGRPAWEAQDGSRELLVLGPAQGRFLCCASWDRAG